MILWIARDKDGTLTIFEKKPKKNLGSWTSSGGTNHEMFVDENQFQELTWEDNEPRAFVVKLK